MARAEPGSKRGSPIIVALVLCVVFSIIHQQAERRIGVDPILGIVKDAALVPSEQVFVTIERWWKDNITSFISSPRLAHENRILKERVDALTLENQQLADERTENDQLRNLLLFQRKSPQPLLAAEVVAIKPSSLSQTLTIADGNNVGAVPSTVVVSPDGSLVGQVVEQSFRSSNVLLLTDNQSSVGAQISRSGLNSGAIGICRGNNGSTIDLTYLPLNADVRIGDAVTTSGLGEIFPKGLVIGTVTAVSVDKIRSIKTAYVMPRADFDHLEYVFLLQHAAIRATGASENNFQLNTKR